MYVKYPILCPWNIKGITHFWHFSKKQINSQMRPVSNFANVNTLSLSDKTFNLTWKEITDEGSKRSFLCLVHYLGKVMYETSDKIAYMKGIITIIIINQPRVKTLDK